MSEPAIAVRLELREEVLGIALPAGAFRLDDDVAEELVERVAVLPRTERVRLRVSVTPPEAARRPIAEVIHHRYAVLGKRAEYRLKRTVRAGRFSLLVGTLVLLAALGLAEALSSTASGGLSIVIEEGLTIVGWVALWRPLDLLLFERWVLKREIAVYRRLEEAEVELTPLTT